MYARSILAAAGLACSAAALPATLVLEPSHDSSLYTGTLGSDGLADGAGEYLWLSTTAEGLARRMLLRFDLSALPAGTVVRQARLSLYESRSRTSHPVRLHRVLQAWGEGASNGGSAGTGAPATAGDATWVSRFHPGQAWQTPGGDFVPQPSAQVLAGLPNERVVWGSTAGMVADVQAWIARPGANHGWILIGDESTPQSAKRFESRQNATIVNRPRLELEFDPPPSPEGDVPLPAWALALAGAGLAAAWRRRGFSDR